MKAGWWAKDAFSKCKGLKDQTLGLIGFGKVAQLVCKMAKALEINVLVHTRTQHSGLEKELGFTYAKDLTHLL
jgi:phosphoglycerate dehydrogenase-like enzyme